MLYGTETTTDSIRAFNYLDSCEIWFYRRIFKILWTARMGNEIVLKTIKEYKEKRSIRRTIENRKIRYFRGHIIRRKVDDNAFFF